MMQFTREELILLKVYVDVISGDNLVNTIPEWIENDQGEKLQTENILQSIKNKVVEEYRDEHCSLFPIQFLIDNK